ncbi:MAG: 30S ribosomal protein S27ae [Candidatus Woesearchaeota archaeon]
MADKKGKRKNRKVVQISKLYQGTKVKNKVCPKCGPGVFMAEHKNRISCGKCGYTEFKK